MGCAPTGTHSVPLHFRFKEQLRLYRVRYARDKRVQLQLTLYTRGAGLAQAV
jgi:hypothetical protein